jgi:iron complex outermembrane receptor protein
MHHLVFIAGLILGISINTSDPGGVIRGKVSDKLTSEPLEGVYVIYGRNSGTTTGPDGRYEIISTPGHVNIIFQLVGYESISHDLTLNEGDTVDLNIALTTKLREIDQIVVSANKTEQKIAELSVSMDIIKTSFLAANHITDPQELVNKTTGIEVLDGQASIRGGSGFSYGAGSRVLALIDGLPMLSADAGNIKWQYLPLENISQIEIIKGASSVLYGSSALNGVINFRTSDASNIPVSKIVTEVGLYGNPGNNSWIWWKSPQKFSSTSISHLQKFGKTDLAVSGHLLLDEGYRRLNDETLGRLNLKLKHFNGKVDGLTYGMNLNAGYNEKRDFVLWEDAEQGALKQSESTAREYHGTFLTVDPFISLKKSNRYSHDLKVRLQSTTNRLPDDITKNSDAVSLYSEYQFRYRLLSYMDLTAGLSENYSKVNSRFFNDHTSFTFAGFTQAEFNPLSRLKAVAGLRVESYSLDGIHDRTVPILRAGVNWQAAQYTYLRASFGQGYRFPAMAEKFAATTIGSIRIIENPGLRSESGWNAEVGLKQGISFGNLSGQADLSFFFMRNSDLIEFIMVSTDEGFGFMATNREESRIMGTEAEFVITGSLGQVSTTITGGYSFINPVDIEASPNENRYLKYRRKHSAKISFDADWKKFEAGISLYAKSKILNIDDAFVNPITRESFLPGFYEYWLGHNTGHFLIDAMAGYNLNEKLKFSLAVKNITNTEYMGRPGDIQPQRNYSLRLSANF